MNTRLVRFNVTALLLVLIAAGHGYAKPAGNGKLDEKLRALVSRGCTGPQSVIISVRPGYRHGLQQSLTSHGDAVTGEFASLDAVAANVHCEDLERLATFASVRAVSINAKVRVTAAFGPALRAAAAASAAKKAGIVAAPSPRAAVAAIGVAVIDSGIAPAPEFGDRITAFYDFTAGPVKAASPRDPYGHGTHVAGLIGGTSVGVATSARLIGLRVLDTKGEGTTDNVVRAIEFAVANKTALGINVINLSLGHPIFESAATDPLVQAVERAAQSGLTVVVSAGNFGMNPDTDEEGYAGVTSPGNAPSAITAGAVKTFDTPTPDDDRIAPYSSRGPTWYDGFAKPDVVAPGDKMLSLSAEHSALRREAEKRGLVSGNYMRLSGTSMAAGFTAGIAALVLGSNPALTPNTVKAVLEYTAIPVLDEHGQRYDALTQGTGQVHSSGAITLARAIDPLAPVGENWLLTSIQPYTVINGVSYAWAQSVIWGNRRVVGNELLSEQRPAWSTNVVWGEGLGDEDDNIVWGNNFGDDDNIVWGNSFDEDDNIVWGNNIVWGGWDDDNIVWGNLFDEDDNIVWGNIFDEDDNIVWGNAVVWGDGLIGMSWGDDDNIVWGNWDDDDNIVWGNWDDDNIVWGNLFDEDDNIVWGNWDDDDNIVWGNSVLLGL